MTSQPNDNAKRHYPERRYSERRIAGVTNLPILLSVVMLSDIMMDVMAPSYCYDSYSSPFPPVFRTNLYEKDLITTIDS